jgi:hypothetical protein
MRNDPTPRNALDHRDPDVMFAALDKVVAETPLATRRRTPDAVVEPTTEAAEPETARKRSEILSPERVPETLRLERVRTAADTQPRLGLPPLDGAAVPFLRPAPAPAAAASAQQLGPRIFGGSAATDTDTPVEVATIIPATPRWRSLVGMALILLIIIASVQAVLLVWGLRERMPVPAAVPSGGTVAIESTPTGATIVLNGQERGKTPTTLRLDPGEYTLEIISGSVSRRRPVRVRAGSSSTQYFHFAEAAGPAALQLSSQPFGARVTIDGSSRGVTPLTISDLQPGSHTVLVEGPSGSTRQSVQLQSGTTASLTLTLPSVAAAGGWLSVAAPIDVQLFEAGALLGSSQSERIMLPAGRHVVDAVNTTLGYQTTHTVQIGAGAVARLSLDVPPGLLNINALPWAEVSIDGKSMGPTPLGNVSVPIGTHEIVFTHPQLGERRQTATVTLKGPNRVIVNLNQR